VPVTLPPDMSDRLDAVNVLLQAIGEAPVSSIESSEAVDVAAASNCLDEFDRAVQTHGWPWNREYAMTMTPDSDGHILLPANCLAMTRAYPPSGDRIVERGRKLYNQTTHSYVFTETLDVDMILKLDWEELPEAARRYITIWAAQQYQGRIQTSAGVDRILDSAVQEARAGMGHREDEADGLNVVTGNAYVANRLHRSLRRRPN
jgi:hypothetical protein